SRANSHRASLASAHSRLLRRSPAMTRNRTASLPYPTGEAIERLIEAVERLAGEVQFLGGIVEKLQDDFAWALSNDVFHRPDLTRAPAPPLSIRSIPIDALAHDWASRLNRLGPEDLPPEEERDFQQDLFSRKEPHDG